MRALFGYLGRKVTRSCWTDGTHINVYLAFVQASQNTIGAFKYFVQGGGVRDHRENYVYSLRHCSRRCAPAHSGIQKPLRPRLCTIIASHRMTGIKQSLRHATTHGSQPDEPKISHDFLQQNKAMGTIKGRATSRPYISSEFEKPLTSSRTCCRCERIAARAASVSRRITLSKIRLW